MDQKTACPNSADLVRLIRGHVAEPDLSRLAEHLETCPSCQITARTQPPGDTLLDLLRGDDAAADEIVRETPRALIEQLKQIPARASGVHSDAVSTPTARAVVDLLGPAQQPSALGQLGPYRVLKLLGQGGMGAVFLAEEPKLRRPVALKVMLPEVAADPTAKDRFLREARAAAAIKSDHIVTIYQVDEVNGVPCLAMELLEGQTLEDLLGATPKLDAARVIAIARDVAEGLTAAHEKGLVHRDVKPSNLWVEGEPGASATGGRVKILDFGLARVERDDPHLTRQGALVGTPAYMAPEQARGEGAVDARADLFSLGCVLYHLCTGSPPFRAPSVMGTLIAAALDTPPEPARLDAAVPAGLSASARAVIARLDAIGQAKPRRRPAFMLAAVAAFTALAILAGVIFWERPDGKVVRIETNDPAIKIAFDGGDLQVAGAFKEPITLKLGKVGLKVVRGDFEFETDKLIVNKGDKIVLKIEVVEGKVQVVRDGQVVLESRELPDADRRAAEWVLSLGGKVQVQGRKGDIADATQLPKGRFTLAQVDLFPIKAVNDAGLENHKGLDGLHILNIGDTRVTDAGLAQLKDLKSLDDVSLDNLDVTAAGLRHLKDRDMRVLVLHNLPLTDDALPTILGFKNLVRIVLTEARLSEAGLAQLKALKHLTSLQIRSTAATDATLEHFKELQGLSLLDVSDTKVTDAGLARLKEFKGLKTLLVEKTAVTAKGLTEFHAAVPGCRIIHDGGVIEAK